MRVWKVGTTAHGVIANTAGCEYGPYGEAAWTVLWSDGRTTIEANDDLRVFAP